MPLGLSSLPKDILSIIRHVLLQMGLSTNAEMFNIYGYDLDNNSLRGVYI